MCFVLKLYVRRKLAGVRRGFVIVEFRRVFRVRVRLYYNLEFVFGVLG